MAFRESGQITGAESGLLLDILYIFTGELWSAFQTLGFATLRTRLTETNGQVRSFTTRCSGTLLYAFVGLNLDTRQRQPELRQQHGFEKCGRIRYRHLEIQARSLFVENKPFDDLGRLA